MCKLTSRNDLIFLMIKYTKKNPALETVNEKWGYSFVYNVVFVPQITSVTIHLKSPSNEPSEILNC